jgi:glycosyltransferase involved in cell wall biosynthesis
VKVLQVHTQYREQGGEDSVVRAEGELLAAAGHDVVRHIARNPSTAVRTAASLAMSAWNPLAAREARRVAERVRPDIAHVHNTWYALSPSVLAGLAAADVPVVMTLHNYRLLCANANLFRDGHVCEDCVGSHPWHGVRHRCYRGSLAASAPAAGSIALHRALGTWNRHVRLFLALNDFARTRFICGGLPAHKIRVKPNFVSDPGSRPSPPSRSRTVLFVGRLESEKGVETLLDAWNAWGSSEYELVLIGDGRLRPALRERAQPGIRLTGSLSREAVLAWMLRSRALVFPSVLYEGQPIAVLEALGCGLPVLASRLGGNVELLRGWGEDWLVAPGQQVAWTEALRRLEDAGRVDQAGVDARRLYERCFSDQTARQLLEEAYRTALAGQRDEGARGTADGD